MKIALDLNNTIQNQIDEVRRQTWLKYGVALSHNDFSTWDAMLGDRVGIPDDEFTRWAWGSQEIQREAKPFPWAKEIIRLLYQQHEILIVTATQFPEMSQCWLYRHGIPYHQFIPTCDKGGVAWDVLIDDNPVTLESLCIKRRVLRYELPWNACQYHIPAVTGWNLDMIHKLQDIAQAATP